MLGSIVNVNEFINNRILISYFCINFKLMFSYFLNHVLSRYQMLLNHFNTYFSFFFSKDFKAIKFGSGLNSLSHLLHLYSSKSM